LGRREEKRKRTWGKEGDLSNCPGTKRRERECGCKKKGEYDHYEFRMVEGWACRNKGDQKKKKSLRRGGGGQVMAESGSVEAPPDTRKG